MWPTPTEQETTTRFVSQLDKDPVHTLNSSFIQQTFDEDCLICRSSVLSMKIIGNSSFILVLMVGMFISYVRWIVLFHKCVVK